jgi:hypothetical protein
VTAKTEPPVYVVDAMHRGDFPTVGAALGSVSPRILWAVVSGGYLLRSIIWLWLAGRCRRGARATVRACAGRHH